MTAQAAGVFDDARHARRVDVQRTIAAQLRGAPLSRVRGGVHVARDHRQHALVEAPRVHQRGRQIGVAPIAPLVPEVAAPQVARRCAQDGFDLQAGTGNVLKNNEARDNGTEGIENSSSALVLKHNLSTGNRTDLTNDGSIQVNEKNEYATGGPATPTEIE